MKKVLFILMSLLVAQGAFGQNSLGKSDDLGRIALTVYIPEQVEGLPTISKDFLESKISQMVSESGFGSANVANRFIITPKISVTNKSITTGAPSYTLIDFDLTLNIGDGETGTKFDSYTMSLKGMGLNEIKAYQAAFKTINAKDTNIKQFLVNGKSRIIQYYNDQCDYLQERATALKGMNQHDDAIVLLASVPEVCKECYQKSLTSMTKIYEDKLELNCESNIAQAKTLMVGGRFEEALELVQYITPRQKCYPQVQALMTDLQNHQCSVLLGKARASWALHNAEETQNYLKDISFDSKCRPEAVALIKEISEWYRINEKRAWTLELSRQKDEARVRLAEINAIRQVAVAQARNQPKVYVKYNIYAW